MVGQGGSIFEQSGHRVGAHCLRFNEQSIGVLLLVGEGQHVSDQLVESFRWLRKLLTFVGMLRDDHELAPHYRYRATACPGEAIADKPGGPWRSPTGQGRTGEVSSRLSSPYP